VSRLEQLRQLAAAQPNDPFMHYGVALECVKLERWDDALAAFEHALALDASYTAAHMQKAQLQIRLGRRDAAAETLRTGIAAARAKSEKHTADEMNKMLEALG
jgi:tetratricopeptide (TPR) repeat protein